MTDHDPVRLFAPLARQWALEQEAFILKLGAPLDAKQLADAKLVGVKDTARVRLLPVDRIPMPPHPELAEAARRAHIITEASPAVTLGHGIMVRVDRWRDRELMLHQFVHIAQCERSGGLESFVDQYLTDRSTCADFTVGSLEDEARKLAREICAADGPASRA
jgi:hypothetical protein